MSGVDPPNHVAPRVYLTVDSLEPADAVRSGVVAWVDRVYRETLAPLAAEVGEEWTVVVLAKPPLRVWKLRSERVWLKALETLSSSEGISLQLSAGYPMIKLEADLGLHYVARELSVSIASGIVRPDAWPGVQDNLIEHLAAAAEATAASTGYITGGLEGASFETATTFERKLNRRQKVGVAESGRWLRGVFWCTLLSQGHLEALGGIERVEREAPVSRTRRLNGRAGPMLLLQASDDLTDFDPATLAPLVEFLAPVLPPPMQLSELPPPSPPRPEPTVAIDPELGADAVLRLGFQGPLDEDDRTTIDELLDAWYLLAVHGIFDGSVHNMDAPLYEESPETSQYTVGLDLGSAGTAAVDPLVRLFLAARHDLSAALQHVRVEAL